MIEKKRAEEFMNIQKKYGNYELHPRMKIDGYEKEIWDEKTEIIEELKRSVGEKQKKPVSYTHLIGTVRRYVKKQCNAAGKVCGVCVCPLYGVRPSDPRAGSV